MTDHGFESQTWWLSDHSRSVCTCARVWRGENNGDEGIVPWPSPHPREVIPHFPSDTLCLYPASAHVLWENVKRKKNMASLMCIVLENAQDNVKCHRIHKTK